MYRILFVCHGNICRSTMAQSVMAHLVAEAVARASFASILQRPVGRDRQPVARHGLRLQRAGIVVVPHRA
ncbi:MAG: hypothetical protein ACLVKA_09735 [Collinsella aerofaciens]